jgi:hypothetical protein
LVVSVGSSGTRTAYSDGAGCAFFEQLAAGTYTSTVSRTGYVDPTGSQAPSKSVTVQAAQTVAMSFELDVTATLTIRLPNGDYPPIAGVPLTLGNTSLLPSGRVSVAGSGTPRVLANRYPYQSGYTVWAGTCDDADPEGTLPVALVPPATSPYLDVSSAASGGRYHPGASRGAVVSAQPVPSTNLGQVDMAEVQVQVVTSANVPVSGATVTMAHVPWDASTGPSYFPGCANGESYSLGATATDGTLKADTPWGYWDFSTSVPGTTPTRVWLHPSTSTVTVVVTTP